MSYCWRHIGQADSSCSVLDFWLIWEVLFWVNALFCFTSHNSRNWGPSLSLLWCCKISTLGAVIAHHKGTKLATGIEEKSSHFVTCQVIKYLFLFSLCQWRIDEFFDHKRVNIVRKAGAFFFLLRRTYPYEKCIDIDDNRIVHTIPQFFLFDTSEHSSEWIILVTLVLTFSFTITITDITKLAICFGIRPRTSPRIVSRW